MWAIIEVGQFLFGKGDVIPSAYPVVPFALAAALIGMLAVVGDYLLYTLTSNSVLKLTYQGKNFLLFLVVWGAGAGIVALLGAWIDILKISKIACVSAGLAWPILLPRIVASASRREEEEQQV